MIEITITKRVTETYTEVKSFLVKETLTEYSEDGKYDNKKTVVTAKEYEVRDVAMMQTKTQTLLTQNVPDEDFNLKVVLQAINNMIPAITR